MKLLYIGAKQNEVSHGWEQINLRNQVVLETIFDNIIYLPLDDSILGRKVFFGITRSFFHEVDKIITDDTDYVFVCQSSSGKICKYIKKYYPHIRIITFFHNIEVQYAKEYMRVAGIRALYYYLRVKTFEKMAVKYSDMLITLNDRDSDLLENIYGKKSSTSLPTSLEDKFVPQKYTDNKCFSFLFVGAGFYANVEGVQWFINNVLPYVHGDLYVIGKLMKPELFTNLNERVHILGYVDDLADYYRRAKFVISPIFHGGGMKTKTAEALMYGKYILGTNEAFEGYIINSKCMSLCNTADEYIKTINQMVDNIETYNEFARRQFLSYHSYESSINIFKSLLAIV